MWRDLLLNILSDRAASLSNGCQVVIRTQARAGTIIVQSGLGKKESKGGHDSDVCLENVTDILHYCLLKSVGYAIYAETLTSPRISGKPVRPGVAELQRVLSRFE